MREAGKSVISLDSEHEMEDECHALGGCFLDYLSGQYRINLLEPRCWDDGSGPEDPDAPDAFRGTLLSQHISFLRDVFRIYKGFDMIFDLLCDFLNLVRFKKSGDQGYSAIYGSHAKRGRI